MGEANYSLLASFPNKLTKKQQTSLKTFFLEGIRAYDWWQDHRGWTSKAFWPAFKKRFPVVSEYLNLAGLLGQEHSNNLAGKLDFGSADDVKHQLSISETEMTYYAVDIWHFTDWTYLAAFLQQKFGAGEVDWGSDEYGTSSPDHLRLARRARQADELEELLNDRPDLKRTTQPVLKRKLLLLEESTQ